MTSHSPSADLDARHSSLDTLPLLSVRDLTVRVPLGGRLYPAVEGVSFDVAEGESLAIVGESGCGKTLLARGLVNLPPDGGCVEGSVRLGGRELAGEPESAWQRLRGGQLALVFQEPASAFDPVRTVGSQIVEAIRLHRSGSRQRARRPRPRAAGRSRVSRPRPRHGRASAPALGGTAAEGLPRHGARRRPAGPARRRTVVGARRDGGRAGDGAARSAAPRPGPDARSDHPRSRSRRPPQRPSHGALRGPRRGGSRDRRDLPLASAPVHAGPSRFRAEALLGEGRSPGGDPGGGPGSAATPRHRPVRSRLAAPIGSIRASAASRH